MDAESDGRGEAVVGPMLELVTKPVSAAGATLRYAGAFGGGSARLATAAAGAGATITRAYAGAAADQVAGQAVRAGKRTAHSLPPRYASALSSLADVGAGRHVRRVWMRDGRAHVEVHGLDGRGARHQAVAAEVTSALTTLKGVRWAQVNAVAGQVLLGFEEEECGIEDIVSVIDDIERAHGAAREEFAPRGQDEAQPEHPADDAPVFITALALATDATSLLVAGLSRLTGVALLPRAARIPLLLADIHPWSRQQLERRLGHHQAEFLIAFTDAVVEAATQGPGPLAVDGAHQVLRLGERLSRKAVWRRRERELAGEGEHLAGVAPDSGVRPEPLPPGPVEQLGDRSSLLALLGGGLALVGDPERAADLMLATMPKAGRQGREAYAAVLGMMLARHGVVPLDGTALRRMDRVTAIVIDSSVLCGDREVVLDVQPRGSLAASDAWQLAEGLLGSGEGPEPGERGGWSLRGSRRRADPPGERWLDLVDERGTVQGRVQAGLELDPLAEAVLAAARQAVDRVLITSDASTAELAQWADDVLPADGDLHQHVRRLQAEGHGVLVVSRDRDAALHAADVAVAVLPAGDGTGTAARGTKAAWCADLVTGPGLAEVWRILAAVPVSAAVSRRSSRLAWGGSALSALIAVTGERHRPTRLPRLSPVHAAGMLAVLGGAVTGLRLGRRAAPPSALRASWHAMSGRDAYERVRRHRDEAERQAAAQRRRPGVRAARRVGALVVSAEPVHRLVVPPLRSTKEFGEAIVDELRDPLTPVLALGAAASAVIGSSVDAMLVTGVMTGNAVVSAGQQMRARRALSRLLLGERPAARVVRWSPPSADGDWLAGLTEAPGQTVPAPKLGLADVIALRTGDVVPADARLLWAEGMEVDESSLTGESLPTAKHAEATPGADLTERACMVYEGCVVVAGRGYGVVTAVGRQTEAGRAGAAAGTERAPRAGIQARLGELTHIALPATGIGGLAVTALAAARGVPLRQALASGVAIAVAAVPEGLPLVATVAQLSAARRLSRKGVLVRSANALEALGRVDTLCFDKTGTLTEGRLAVDRVALFDREVAFEGEAGRRVLAAAARACPEPGDDASGRGSSRLAHPTDRAVVEAFHAHVPDGFGAWRREIELPFEASRGYSATLGREDGRALLTVKGAPEVVLDHCDAVAEDGRSACLSADLRARADEALKRLADDGLRVLAVAERALDQDAVPGPAPEQLAERIERLTLVGFVAIADSARPGAAPAVAGLGETGVRTLMITGDHPRTAAAIAGRLGIPDAGHVLTGAEIERLPKARRDARIAASTVFARVSPHQKVLIVQSLQRSGKVVAMVGDGSNDAAAIRLADVGVALAGTGTRPARSAADLVLTDPEPTRLVEAVAEGRALWRSVGDAVGILVGGNAGEVAFTLLGTALGGRAPLGTRQFLLVNMMTDMLPALAVALAPARPAADGRSGPVTGVWAPELGREVAARGAATTLGALLAWQGGRLIGRPRASTMALAALVGTQLGQTLWTGRHSPLVLGTCAGSALALFAVVETPVVSRFFGCRPLGPAEWGVVGACTVTATFAAALAPGLVDRIAKRLQES
jgi:cation-transporting ATPase I